MTWVVWYLVPGDTAPVPEYCNTREEAEDFANKAIEAGWYVVKIEEVGSRGDR